MNFLEIKEASQANQGSYSKNELAKPGAGDLVSLPNEKFGRVMLNN